MTELLFDTPLWLTATIIGAGVLLFWMGNVRLEKKIRNAGEALLGLAVLLLLVSAVMDTPRERVIYQTRELVHSVEKRDWPAMTQLLDPRCTLDKYNNRDEIVAAAQTAVERFEIRNITMTSLDAKQDAASITVHLDVLSELNISMGRPVPTRWQLDWQKSAGQWLLRNVNVLESSQAGSQNAVKQNLPNVKP
jgi:hypothetical protein